MSKSKIEEIGENLKSEHDFYVIYFSDTEKVKSMIVAENISDYISFKDELKNEVLRDLGVTESVLNYIKTTPPKEMKKIAKLAKIQALEIELQKLKSEI